jgi:hypothetical protein
VRKGKKGGAGVEKPGKPHKSDLKVCNLCQLSIEFGGDPTFIPKKMRFKTRTIGSREGGVLSLPIIISSLEGKLFIHLHGFP